MSRPITRPVAPGMEAMRRIREARGMSYQAVARAFAERGRPVKGNTIARYEAGERSIDTDTLVLLADVLGATPNQILGREDWSGGTITPQSGEDVVSRDAVQRAISALSSAGMLSLPPSVLGKITVAVADALSNIEDQELSQQVARAIARAMLVHEKA
jgi:transcriptional regulator with XRE-family HTH domain